MNKVENKTATISVVINTYNAERVFEKCLESVKGADEIIVCDMYSEDRTIEIAQKFNCKIFYHERCGYAEPARNFANSQATSDWVLVLDADEIVTPELWLYLRDFADNAPENTVMLSIPRENIILGQKLRCTYQKGIKRFWRNGIAEYKAHVHSTPKDYKGDDAHISPRCRNLALQHYHIDTFHSFIEKMNRYTDFETERFEAREQKFSLWNLIWRPAFEFFKCYILKGGCFDGVCGFIMCILNAQYKFVQNAKLYEMEYKKCHPDLIY